MSDRSAKQGRSFLESADARTLELRDDPQLIAEYRRRHSQGAIWPEIPAGIREAGILEMEIYLLDTRLFMIVEVPVGFDWDAAMERLASLPRQQEWEDYMAIFQLVKPGSTAAEKCNLLPTSSTPSPTSQAFRRLPRAEFQSP